MALTQDEIAQITKALRPELDMRIKKELTKYNAQLWRDIYAMVHRRILGVIEMIAGRYVSRS